VTHFAILLEGPNEQPRVVRLAESGECLTLLGSDGIHSQVPWWRIFRVSNEGTIHRFKRLDQRDWELRVTSGADRDLVARVGKRPLARLLYPFRRLHLLKTIIGAIVLLAAIAQHLPPEWTARMMSSRLQHRLVDGVIAQNAAKRCSHAGGEEAFRKLLVRLDRDLGGTVEIVGLNDGAFIVTAAPPNLIVVTRGALQHADAEAMAALVAHQLSHLRHDDELVAMVRHEGTWGIWGALLEGRLPDIRMNFSGLEERRADTEAMAMLHRANISMQPAAQMFEEIRISRAQGSYVAYEYRDFHFGIDSQAKRWAAAAEAKRAGSRTGSALDRNDSDALFNFCWPGRLPPAERQQGLPPLPPEPGSGAISSKEQTNVKLT